MDVDLPAEDDPRRVEVRAWFAAHPTPTPAELVDAGYVVPHWPAPYGLDAEPELQLIIEDEMRRAGVTKPVNPIGASGMLRFGEAALQVRGMAGEHQVEGASVALAQAYGGAAQYFAMWVVASEMP